MGPSILLAAWWLLVPLLSRASDSLPPGLREETLRASCVSPDLAEVLKELKFESAGSLKSTIARYKAGALLLSPELVSKVREELAAGGAPGPRADRILLLQYRPVIAHEAQHALHERIFGCNLASIEDEWSAALTGLGCYQELIQKEPEALKVPTLLTRDEEAIRGAWKEGGPQGVLDVLGTGFVYSMKPSIREENYLEENRGSLGRRLKVLEKASARCAEGSEACREALRDGPIGLLGLKGAEDLEREIKLTREARDCLTPDSVDRARLYFTARESWAKDAWCAQFPEKCGGAAPKQKKAP